MKLTAQARFASATIYPALVSALRVIEARQEQIDRTFKAAVLDDRSKPSWFRRKPKDFKAALDSMLPIAHESLQTDMNFATAWYQYKYFYNAVVETYNGIAATIASISEGHAQEIIMDVEDFYFIQELAKDDVPVE